MFEFEKNLHDEEGKYEKVIFLDIDGVLNDDGKLKSKGVYIDEERVKRLAKIVEQTGAEIVLSSSWRRAYRAYVANNYTTEEKTLLMLKQYFDKYNLKIADCTEFLTTGSLARPAEIRNWLLYRCDTQRFVILDDDDFWCWNWLYDFLVLTKEKVDIYTIKRGLEDKHVEKAVEILNKKMPDRVM